MGTQFSHMQILKFSIRWGNYITYSIMTLTGIEPITLPTYDRHSTKPLVYKVQDKCL